MTKQLCRYCHFPLDNDHEELFAEAENLEKPKNCHVVCWKDSQNGIEKAITRLKKNATAS